MKSEEATTLLRHEYDLVVSDCYNEITRRIENEIIDAKLKIHYLSVFKHAKKTFEESVNITKTLTIVERYKLYFIKTDHPAFYSWFAYFLTTQLPFKIALILDLYGSGKYGSVPNFNNKVEYILMKCLAHVPFNHDKQDQAVMQWVRETNYNLDQSHQNGGLNFIKPTDFLQDESAISKVKITSEGQERLKICFAEFLDSTDERSRFNEIMEGKHVKPGHEIFLNMKANIFCDAIKRIHDKGNIITSKKNKIANWIVTNFLFDVKGNRKKVNLNYCTQLISGKDSPADKDSIDIDYTDR